MNSDIKYSAFLYLLTFAVLPQEILMRMVIDVHSQMKRIEFEPLPSSYASLFYFGE